MSLKVPADVLSEAQSGTLTEADFLRCIETSLPYAWSVVEGLGRQIEAGQPCAEDGTAPPSDAAHAELLRLVASDAMRAAVQQRFGARLAFQNCCKVGLFTPAAADAHAEFTSPRAQVLNQAPELINC